MGERMSLFSTLFWGIFLLAAGAVLLIKHLFNMQWVQGGKLIFGIFIVLVGISMLTSNFGMHSFNSDDDTVSVFTGSQHIEAQDNKNYTVIFGSSEVDLTNIAPGSRVEVNAIFGSSHVVLPDGPVKVDANCAFGSVKLPDGSLTFGDRSYNREGDNPVRVEINCVFGGIQADE